MNDQSGNDATYFKLAVLQNLALGEAKQKHYKWERQFAVKLQNEISSSGFNPCYVFEGDVARKHIEDYLEAFRSSFRYINTAVGNLHDGKDVLYNITLRARQSLLDRILNRYGKSFDEWNFPRKEVMRLEGSSLNFVLTVGEQRYSFTPGGASRQ
jgi:hypothetical protein